MGCYTRWREQVEDHGTLARLEVRDLPQVLMDPDEWAQRTRVRAHESGDAANPSWAALEAAFPRA